MLKILSKKFWFGLFLGFGSLFVVAVSGGEIAYQNAAALNNALNISTTKKSGSSVYFETEHNDAESLKAYVKDVCTEAEEEGLALLKNDNAALPLSNGAKVSLLGNACVAINYNASGSSSTASTGYPTLKEALSEVGLSVNPTTDEFYRSGAGSSYGRYLDSGTLYKINEAPWSVYTDDVKSSLSEYGDAAIVTFARDSGEGKDLSTYRSDGEDGSYLSISPEEEELLKQLTALKEAGNIKKIIVLLNSPNPMELDFLYREGIDVDAVMWVGAVGAYGLYGVANAIIGEANPSGRITDTFCRDNFSSPAMASWGSNKLKLFSQGYSNYSEMGLESSNRSYGVYVEGVYVGYRYYETRYEDAVLSQGNAGSFVYDDVVAFPFGHGLSYTSFSYSDFAVSEKDDSFDVSVTVTNTGDTAGKHAVQIYAERPYTAYDKQHGLEKPSVELAGYGKTALIAAGGSETLTINIEKDRLKTYDNDGYKTYILEDGDYYLTLADDAHMAINNILREKGVDPSKLSGTYLSSTTYKWTNETLDASTYSVSSETGYPITNQFDHADINRYEGRGDNGVTYVSRSDWEGTFPNASISLSVGSEQMLSDLSSGSTLPEGGEMPSYNQNGDLKLPDLRSSEEDPVPYDDERWDELLDQMSFEEQAYLVTNGQNATNTIESISLPETKEADGSTAVTATKTNSSFPCEAIWAASFDTEILRKIGDAIAEEAVFAGIQGMYAPGMNIHRAPFIGRSSEYYSEDPYLSAISGMHEVKGMQDKGVIATIKHFAFNDEETNRNGISIWLNEQSAREIYLLPFEYSAANDKGDAASLMSSFNRAGCTWVGADSNAQINVLEKEWGFDGYIITDMAESNAASYMVYDDAFLNGTNLFLGTGSSSALDSWKNNAAFCEKVRESTHRILYSICNYSIAMNGAESGVAYVAPWWQGAILGLEIASGVVAFGSLGVYIAGRFLNTRKKED